MERCLSPVELSERWAGKISPKTLANWRSDPAGKGPRFKRFGNRILYPMSAVEQWEEQQNFGTTRDYGKRHAA